jgi:hypothetical protein
MAVYIPPNPAIAEQVYRDRAASEAQHARLENAPTEEMKRVARDPAEPVEARANAMLVLLVRRDPSVSEIFPELFEHPKLAHLAIRHCPLSDPAVVDRVRGLLDHPRDRIWSEAAVALSRNHGWNMAHLPHAFTADGIHETRVWLEQQLEGALQSAPDNIDE